MPVSFPPTSSLPSGTAAAPSVGWAASPGNGFYLSAANNVGIAIAGIAQGVFSSASGLRLSNGGSTGTRLDLFDDGSVALVAAGLNKNLSLTPNGLGAVLVSGASNNLNGALQLATHSTFGGGLAFGGAAGGETIWRDSSSVLKIGGNMKMTKLVLKGTGTFGASLGSEGDTTVVAYGTLSDTYAIMKANRFWSSSPVAGWTTVPTGTLTRTTFDPSTVTLAGLAQRVAALIVDLHSAGGLASHALIGP